MQKEILLYGSINSDSAESFIRSVDELQNEDSITLRINSNGGSPEDLYGMIAKWKEYKGKKTVKIDGKAHSSAFYFLAFANSEIEALDVSKALIHRAGYPERIEKNSEVMTSERWEYLNNLNVSLREGIESIATSENFAKVTGKTYDDIFSNDGRLDVVLNASQLKELGFIKTINKITPERQRKIDAEYNLISAEFDGCKIVATEDENKNKLLTNKKMTKTELKTEHPEIYAEIMLEGATAERDNIGAWLPFIEADADRVIGAIKKGEKLTQTDMSDLMIKKFAKTEIKAQEAQSPEAVVTESVVIEAEETEIEKFRKEALAKRKAQ